MRLIDADEVIEKVKNTSLDVELWTSMRPDEILKVAIETHIDHVIETIESQPTAYDVEAVVGELEEELKYHAKGELHCEEKGYESGADRHRQKVIAYDTAIEIVKRGGRNE